MIRSKLIRRMITRGANLLRPPPSRTADKWADDCRILPPGTAEPGPWRSLRAPYFIPIMRACSSPKYSKVIVITGSQMGKTEFIFNVIGWRMDDDPTPGLLICPTQKLAESMSRDRIMSMFKSTPALWDKLAKGQQNKISEKFISGVRLGFAWAGSATELSSHPAGLVCIDERDRMKDDVGEEGDPVELAEARTATYPDAKIIVTSSPTIEGASAIHRLFEEGTQFLWHVPCPECDAYFVPSLELLKWPKDCSPNQAVDEARLACPHCGSMLEDRHRQEMNSSGMMLTENGEQVGEEPPNDIFSAWVPGLCSPWRTWGSRARDFIRATKSQSPGRVQAVVNTRFGELYKMTGDAPSWEIVAQLRRGYESGVIPEGVQVLTCGVDVQKDRLVYAVRGWGENLESWLIEHGEIWGQTEHDSVWSGLADLLQMERAGHYVKRMMIDSGYKPGKSPGSDNQIYIFCRRFRSLAFPTKGHQTQDKPLKTSKIDVSFRGKIIKNGLSLWHLDSDFFKSWVHSRIRWPEGESGAWHLPVDATDDYCQQLVAEQRLVKSTGLATWIVVNKDNHFLDAEAINAAAAYSLNLQRLKALPPKTQNEKIDGTPKITPVDSGKRPPRYRDRLIIR